MWGKHGINKVSILENGIVVVRFDTAVGKNEVIQGGIYHFDNKPFIVKAWDPEMEFTREALYTVPIWVKLPGLEFKYWSLKGLSKIGSLIGKPIMVDQNIEKKKGLSFARLLVEVDIASMLPDKIFFKNERGDLVEQLVKYDWKPTLCSYCQKYGHMEDQCRKKKGQENNQKVDIGNGNPQTEEVQKVATQQVVEVTEATGSEGHKTQNTGRQQVNPEGNQHKDQQRDGVKVAGTTTGGMNAPNKQKEVKFLCSQENIALVGFVETKIKENIIEQVASRLFSDWGLITNLDQHLNERVLITWRPDYFEVTLKSSTAQAVTCEVVHTALQTTFLLTVVYAFNTREERRSLWSYLESVHRGVTQPWVLMGDFNAVLNMDDRIGRSRVSMAEVYEFHDCVEACGLMELPAQGSGNTWSVNRGKTENANMLKKWEENMAKALHEGPWFILGHVLSVRRWEPKFIASSTKIQFSAIWTRLPELPTEFYDMDILRKVGNKIGRLLKVDTCTSSTTRGSYQ
ncbi:uncharacterized protein LOC132057943 [Lycium ferocissimum]|uniref:uncharacterized protein LOC132057943 n=1 Tax=Lycium ferocissimum TaxID=112874 RepID=UPI002814EB76|nr:uncharacterized protein LOC132057943 [Lycium ferocissimum]